MIFGTHVANAMPRPASSTYVLPSDVQIRATLSAYGFGPTQAFCEKTRAYIDLLLKWNRRVALTSITSADEILRVHFGESLFAIQAAHIATGRLADVGSGAGFPGVPLAMALPGFEMSLIESNAKKAAFLSELVRVLELMNARVHHGRAESMSVDERFDIVAARATGEYRQLLRWSEERLNADGKAVLWLGEKQIDELAGAKGWVWQRPVRISRTKGRFILVGRLRA